MVSLTPFGNRINWIYSNSESSHFAVRNSDERLLIFELHSQSNYTPPIVLLNQAVDWLE